MKFASFAALSLSYTDALKLSGDFELAQQKLTELEKQGKPDISEVLQSINSISQAYVHHNNEAKLLEGISNQLTSFWQEVD